MTGRWRGRRLSVAVYLHRIDAYTDQEAVLFRLLSAGERRRAECIPGLEDRRRFVAGRAVLRTAAGRAAGVAPARVEIDVLDGRPTLPANPGLQVSLSHSGSVIACAVGSRPVGVDVEGVRMVPGDTLLQRTCTVREAATVRRSTDPAATFTQLWVRKEAVIKALGVGLGYSLTSVDVYDRRARGLHGLWRLSDLRLPVGYAGAVAAQGAYWRLRLYDVDETTELLATVTSTGSSGR